MLGVLEGVEAPAAVQPVTAAIAFEVVAAGAAEDPVVDPVFFDVVVPGAGAIRSLPPRPSISSAPPPASLVPTMVAPTPAHVAL